MSHDAASFSKKVNKMSTRKRGRHVGSGLVVDRDKKKYAVGRGGRYECEICIWNHFEEWNSVRGSKYSLVDYV